MVKLRKAVAGSTSLGHEWPEDGAVVEVPNEDAAALLGIPDGGFSEVVDADEASPVDEAPRPARRRRREDEKDDDSADVAE